MQGRVLRDLSVQAPAVQATEKREYFPIDTDNLAKDDRDMYLEYRDLIRQAMAVREKLEDSLMPKLQAYIAQDVELATKAKNKEVQFHYNYNMLQFSFEIPKPKSTKAVKKIVLG